MSLKYFCYPLSEDIITKVADYLLNSYSLEDFESIYVIFSGRRPSLFLKKRLAEKIFSSYIPPEVLSIEDFVYKICSTARVFSGISDLDAIYELYTIILKNCYFNNLKFKSFVEFVPWGYEIFNFLEQLLLENIDDSKLEYIENLAKIGFEVPPNINELLKDIKKIKNDFYSKLLDRGVFTRGLLYKFASEWILKVKLNNVKEIIFVTPFYLHSTEIDLLNNLISMYNVTIFFQSPKEIPEQLKYLSKKLNIQLIIDKEDKLPKNIYFYSTFDKHSEISCLNRILKKLPKEEVNNTVVVLPDDETATVLVNALPENIKEFNLVCGYPLKHSIVYSLLYSIFNAQLTKKQNLYHSKRYFDVLKNNLVVNLNFEVSNEVIAKVIETLELIHLGVIFDENISRSNFIQLESVEQSIPLYTHLFDVLKSLNISLEKEKLIETIKKVHYLLFYQWEKIENFVDFSNKIKTLVDLILCNNLANQEPFILEIFKKLYEVCDVLERSIFAKDKFKKEEIFRLFLNELEKAKIAFSGSPLRGLQILGFYETRNLNFENVIILDLNEGILPYIRTKHPFIPREVLINLGIDRIEIEEQIQRYHFWRLISSARNVYMIYIESAQKERSRFVEQVIWMQQKEQNMLQIKNLFNCYFKVNLNISKTEINKTEEIIKYLKQMTFSPTVVDTYLNCPLKFYFRHILSLTPLKQISEEAEEEDIGKFVHSLLYESFKKYEGSLPIIDDNFKKSFFELFNIKFEKELKKLYKTEAYMVKSVMKAILEKFLEYEKERLFNDKIRIILSVEKKFEDKIDFSDIRLNFKFIIDRIEKTLDDTILVIDYKTGTISDLDELEEFEKTTEYIRSKVTSFQLPLYVHIVEKNYCVNRINAMIYSVKNPENSKILFKDILSKEEIQRKYFEALEHIISEIFDIKIPFYADTSDEKKCRFCEYRYMCR